ncbi:hypothetical protein FACS1894139_07800 [Planctomycetales bacterium]|nr:hypothetical protein FACS1894107_09300 [Planctomycetales bacterium]GHS99247.1 hypothetical protein FACS1894108_08860 [Planctomycetales bacterium]GHT04892.1 hypothetical protein FACS1894139_07800 [Planctomycetales bacterium]
MDANERFNDELAQFFAGALPAHHIFKLGLPGEILRNTGFPAENEIELAAARLHEKMGYVRHPFAPEDIKNLVSALDAPVAVFSYGDGNKAQNVIVDLQKDGKNFLVGVHFNQEREGTVISSIRTLFNKDNHKWLNWIDGKRNELLYADIKKLQVLVAQQRTNFADVDYLNLKVIDNLIERHRTVKDYYSPSVLKTTQNKGGNEMAVSKVAMVSLLNGNPQMKLSDLQALRAQGQEIDYAADDSRGRNALHLAVEAGADADLLDDLMAQGVDANAKDARGKTPLALAREHNLPWLPAQDAAAHYDNEAAIKSDVDAMKDIARDATAALRSVEWNLAQAVEPENPATPKKEKPANYQEAATKTDADKMTNDLRANIIAVKESQLAVGGGASFAEYVKQFPDDKAIQGLNRPVRQPIRGNFSANFPSRRVKIPRNTLGIASSFFLAKRKIRHENLLTLGYRTGLINW